LHEWSIAEGIVDVLLEMFKDKKLREVDIKIGELRDLDLDVLRSALNILSESRSLKGLKFNLHVSKARFKCLNCGEEWGLEKALEMVEETIGAESVIIEESGSELPLHFIPSLIIGLQKCPSCGMMDIAIDSGRELEITRVVVEDDRS